MKVERKNDRIDVVRWTGSAPPDQFAEFRLIARNPILEGDLSWKITRRTPTVSPPAGSDRREASSPASVTG